MPQDSDYLWVNVAKEHDVYRARFKAKQACESLGMGSYEVAIVETSVSELGWNLVVHAKGGMLGFRPFKDSYRVGGIKDRDFIRTLRYKNRSLILHEDSEIQIEGVEIVSVDNGPGILDIEVVFSESYVSKTGLGRGLKSVKGMMDEFAILSSQGKGALIWCRKWARINQVSP